MLSSDLNKCGNCQNSRFRLMQKRDSKSRGFLQVGVCLNCGLFQQVPLPTADELTIYYSHNYRKEYKETYVPSSKHIARAGITAMERLVWMANLIKIEPDTTLLDVGSGGGEFVFLASRVGYVASGIEPNLGYSDFARTEYNVQVRTSMLGDLEDDSYHIITMFHVLEHMADPRQVVQKVWKSLKAEGWWVVEVPNILQVDASPNNIFFKAHIFYYSLMTLSRVAGEFFELVWANEKGNLKIIFKKRQYPLKRRLTSEENEIEEQIAQFQRKSWLTYLVVGHGWSKLFRNTARRIREIPYSGKKPRDILGEIFENKKHMVVNR